MRNIVVSVTVDLKIIHLTRILTYVAIDTPPSRKASAFKALITTAMYTSCKYTNLPIYILSGLDKHSGPSATVRFTEMEKV